MKFSCRTISLTNAYVTLHENKVGIECKWRQWFIKLCCKWEAECDWCCDLRIVENYLSRQDGSICNSNWRVIGADKREENRGIKWYNRYNYNISEG